MPAHKFVELRTGAEMPTVGLGTWRSAPSDVAKAIEVAIKAGYRHIDTAAAYGNEKQVGDGLKIGIQAAGIDRKDIFLTTKLNNDDHGNPLLALESSLAKLQTPYLDLWLMHWPAPMLKGCTGADKSIDWLDTWKKMERIYRSHPDKVKAIGVSNTYVPYLKRLLKVATVVPAVNQIELHPSCPGVEINSNLHENPVVKEIAQKYSVKPANILISLQANREGVAVIPKSVTEQRIIDNLKIVDLTSEEVARLIDIHKSQPFRVCTPQWTGWGDVGFPPA